MTDIRQIPIKFIRTNGKTQVRMAMDQGAICEYAEAMKEGVQFPPVVLFLDKDIYWLGDGFHRVEAAQAAGKKNIKADVRQGGLREAQFFAIGANHDHGLRRTNADKRNAVSLLLDDAQWSEWTNRQIAKQAGVAPGLVDKMRAERVPTVGTPEPKESQRKEDAMPPAPGKPAPAAAPLPALPDELLQFDTWDDQDLEDAFHSRLESLLEKVKAAKVKIEKGWQYPWYTAFERDRRDGFTRLLVAEVRKTPSMALTTDQERDAWLAQHQAAPKPGSLAEAVAKCGGKLSNAPAPNRVLDAMEDLLEDLPLTPTVTKVPTGQVLVPIADRARLAQLENLLPQKEEEIKELARKLEEAGSQVQELNDENQSLHRILDAEDLLKAFKAEVARAQALARTTEERNRGLQNQCKSLERSAKSWKRKAEALERKTKGAPEPDPELPSDESPYPPAEV